MALRYAYGERVKAFGIVIGNTTDYVYWNGITPYWKHLKDYHNEIMQAKSFIMAKWRLEMMEMDLEFFLEDAYILEAKGSVSNQKALQSLVDVAYFMLEQAHAHARTLK